MKKTKIAAPVLIACVALAGCANILGGQPHLSRGRQAQESAARYDRLEAYEAHKRAKAAAAAARYDGLEALEEADTAARGRLRVLEDADRSAREKAHPEEGALEGQAAWKLNELQGQLEAAVRP